MDTPDTPVKHEPPDFKQLTQSTDAGYQGSACELYRAVADANALDRIQAFNIIKDANTNDRVDAVKSGHTAIPPQINTVNEVVTDEKTGDPMLRQYIDVPNAFSFSQDFDLKTGRSGVGVGSGNVIGSCEIRGW